MNKLMRAFTLAIFACAAPANAVALNPIPPLKPLYSAYSASLNDNVYTTDAGLITLLTSYGAPYVNTGIVGYVETRQQPNTLPFKRYWKDTPQTDNFYTTDPSESQYVLANGWYYVGTDAYLYTWQVPGSIPLYRMNRFNAATSDLVHKYTTNYLQVQQLQAQGWAYDRVAGYLYSTATPKVAEGWILGRRCPSGSCSGSNYRDYYMPLLSVPTTAKPAGTTRQRIRFSFWSPDYFGAGSGHFSVGGHGRLGFSTQQIDTLCQPGQESSGTCTYHRGAGLIVVGGGCSVCGGNPQLATELFWVQSNSLQAPTSYSGETLVNNQTYTLELILSDSGDESYAIRHSSGRTIASSSLATASLFPSSSPFPSELTGYWIAHATDSTRDFTIYITNISVSWLP